MAINWRNLCRERVCLFASGCFLLTTSCKTDQPLPILRDKIGKLNKKGPSSWGNSNPVVKTVFPSVLLPSGLLVGGIFLLVGNRSLSIDGEEMSNDLSCQQAEVQQQPTYEMLKPAINRTPSPLPRIGCMAPDSSSPPSFDLVGLVKLGKVNPYHHPPSQSDITFSLQIVLIKRCLSKGV